MIVRRCVFLLVAMIVLVGTAACGSGGSGSTSATPTGAGAANTIVIKSFMFSPMTLTVAPGAKVTVHNEDSATHTLTASNGTFNTGNITGGSTATFTAPSKPGAYSYLCDIHQYMQGTLTVK